jgi:hypothetical protein
MSLGIPKRGETAFDWLAVLLAMVLAGLHVYVWYSTGREPFLVVAGMFLLGVVFFFTNYWRAVVYLLAALYATTLGVLWVLRGMNYSEVGVATAVVSVAFIGLVVYLFFVESDMSD